MQYIIWFFANIFREFCCSSAKILWMLKVIGNKYMLDSMLLLLCTGAERSWYSFLCTPWVCILVKGILSKHLYTFRRFTNLLIMYTRLQWRFTKRGARISFFNFTHIVYISITCSSFDQLLWGKRPHINGSEYASAPRAVQKFKSEF